MARSCPWRRPPRPLPPAPGSSGDGRLTPFVLELAVPPHGVGPLRHHPLLRASRPSLAKPRPLRIAWHDTADAALANDGLALADERQGRARQWRLERLHPPPDEISPPGFLPPSLAEAALPNALDHALGHTLGHTLTGPLRVAARLEGTRRAARLAFEQAEIAIELIVGTVTTVAGEKKLARLRLAGPPASVFKLAGQLLADLPLALPAAGLAEEALAKPASPAAGSPLLPPNLTADAAAAWLMATLSRILAALAPAAAAGEESEPVHQMRVAIRRLRTAITLLQPLLGAPAPLAEASEALRAFGRVLGPAREWDVFLEGPAASVRAIFPTDRGVARLLKAAQRRREACYATLRAALEAAEFRSLILRLTELAVERPWRQQPARLGAGATANPPAAMAENPTPDAHVPETLVADILMTEAAPALLHRRQRKLVSAAADIEHADAAQLHAIRLRAKRLRYAGEILSPLFPGRHSRRFLRRLTGLQDRLGHLNDAAQVERLLAELGPTGTGRAGGIVLGFVAAGAAAERARIGPAWRRFRKRAPFWS